MRSLIVIAKIEHTGGEVIYSHPLPCCSTNENGRGAIPDPGRIAWRRAYSSGTAHALDARTFPIPVMGKTGTTNDYRDALFVGSTYGPDGITVAVRIGFDDNRSLGAMETGGRAALPVFREVMLKTYQAKLVGPVPSFPADMEQNIEAYLNGKPTEEEVTKFFNSPNTGDVAADRIRSCRAADTMLATKTCAPPVVPLPVVYPLRDSHGRIVFTNE